MQERGIGKMKNMEMISQLEKIIVSNKYNIDEVLDMIPDDLKEELKTMLKFRIQDESKKLKLEKHHLNK